MRTFTRALVSTVALTTLVAAAPGRASEIRVDDLPPGPGRQETFYTCTACHAYRLVAAQSQTRSQWDDTLDWMAKRHGMPPVGDEDRKLILDYLAANHGPTPGPTRGYRNPFLN